MQYFLIKEDLKLLHDAYDVFYQSIVVNNAKDAIKVCLKINAIFVICYFEKKNIVNKIFGIEKNDEKINFCKIIFG